MRVTGANRSLKPRRAATIERAPEAAPNPARSRDRGDRVTGLVGDRVDDHLLAHRRQLASRRVDRLERVAHQRVRRKFARAQLDRASIGERHAVGFDELGIADDRERPHPQRISEDYRWARM